MTSSQSDDQAVAAANTFWGLRQIDSYIICKTVKGNVVLLRNWCEGQQIQREEHGAQHRTLRDTTGEWGFFFRGTTRWTFCLISRTEAEPFIPAWVSNCDTRKKWSLSPRMEETPESAVKSLQTISIFALSLLVHLTLTLFSKFKY